MVTESITRQREAIAEMRAKGTGARPRPISRMGPGTELKKLIGWIPSLLPWWNKAGCSCDRIANQMDKMGCDWCDRNMVRIVSQIQKSAEGGGVTFPGIEGAIRKAVEWAVWRARRIDTMRKLENERTMPHGTTENRK